MASLSKIVRASASGKKISDERRAELVDVARAATLAGVAPTLTEFLSFTVEERGCWIVGRALALRAAPAAPQKPDREELALDEDLDAALENAARKASQVPE